MQKQDLLSIDTPFGAIPISLKERCFHDGVPSIAIIIDWKLDMDDYGVENGWTFTMNCLEVWLKEEFTYGYAEIISYIKNFTGDE